MAEIMEKKILLVHPHTYFDNINDRRGGESLPIGFGIVNGILREQGASPVILDILGRNLDRKVVRELLEQYAQKQYTAILISAMSTQYAYVKWFINECRKHWPDTVILVGGCLAHFNYQNLLTRTQTDIAILSEAENTLPALLRSDFKDLTGIPSIAYRQSSNFIDHSSDQSVEYHKETKIILHPIVEIDLKDPQCQILPCYEGIDLGLYGSVVEGLSAGNVMTARGCPFSCTFCSKQFERFRLYPIDFIEKQIISLKEQIPDLQYVIFIDEFVLINLKRATEISQLMKKHQLKWACNGRVDTFSAEIANVIKDAGCICVSFGVESGSDKILEAMNKRQTAAKIRKALEIALDAGLEVNPQMIIGFPGEDRKTIKETVKLYKGLHHHGRRGMREVGFGFITPLPGSKLYQDALDSGLIVDEEKYLESLEGGFSKIRVNFTSWSDSDLRKMKDRYTALINIELGLSSYWDRPPGKFRYMLGNLFESDLGHWLKKRIDTLPGLKRIVKKVLRVGK